jgi:hypothetical protein
LRIVMSMLSGAAIVLCGFAAEGNRGKVLVNDDFTGPELQKPWKAMKGEWKISDGVLTGAELAADKHAAVIRRPLKFKNAAFEIPFQLNGAKTIHLSINDKGGHLCRVSIDPKGFVLRRDKPNAKSDVKGELLARHAMTLENGKWYTLQVEISGTKFTARIGNDHVASAEHPDLGGEKIDIGLPVGGQSAAFKYVHGWELN